VLVEICTYVYYIDMDVSENSGTPKSSILIGFSIINHPVWGTTIYGNTHILMFSNKSSVCSLIASYLLLISTLPLLLRSSVAACQSTRRWAQLYIVGRLFFGWEKNQAAIAASRRILNVEDLVYPKMWILQLS